MVTNGGVNKITHFLLICLINLIRINGFVDMTEGSVVWIGSEETTLRGFPTLINFIAHNISTRIVTCKKSGLVGICVSCESAPNMCRAIISWENFELIFLEYFRKYLFTHLSEMTNVMDIPSAAVVDRRLISKRILIEPY